MTHRHKDEVRRTHALLPFIPAEALDNLMSTISGSVRREQGIALWAVGVAELAVLYSLPDPPVFDYEPQESPPATLPWVLM